MWMGHKAFAFLQRLADKLPYSWESSILSWIRVCLIFAIIWVTGLCLRGPRVRWCIHINDGTGLYFLLIFGWFTDDDYSDVNPKKY